MARVKRVDNSRKEHQCDRGHVIPKGDSYLTAAPGYRSRPKYRCLAHPFRPSELTTSARSEPLAALESFQDQAAVGFDSIEELQDAWDQLGEALSEYVSMREVGLEAWENGNSQLEELLDQAQTAYDDASQFEPEDFDEDEPERDDYKDTPKGQDKFDAAWAEWDEARQEHVTEQTNEALDIIAGLDI